MVYYQNNEKERKPRLFVDMDGTVAEWRQIKLKIDSQIFVEFVASKF